MALELPSSWIGGTEREDLANLTPTLRRATNALLMRNQYNTHSDLPIGI